MSEDLNQGPGKPGEPDQLEQSPNLEQLAQPLAEASFAAEPAREEPPAQAVSQGKQPLQSVSELIRPEQLAERPAYPPPPEFYAQMPVVDPNRPAPGVPVYQPAPGFPPPMPGMPLYPPMPGAPLHPLPPGYVYVPVNQGFKYDFPPVPPVQPQPLGQAVQDLPRQYKKILFKPGVRSFLEEQGRAEWGIIWIQLLFLMFIEVLASIPDVIFAGQESTAATTTGLPPNFLVIETLTLAILGPAFFFAGVGIQYLLARMFKGNGSFKQQAYNQLLYSVPIGVVSSLVAALFSGLTRGAVMATFYVNTSSGTTSPVLDGGYLVGLLFFDLLIGALGIYSIILNVFSIMATHRMTGGKASAVVLIPIAAVYILAFIVVFAAVAIAITHMPAVR